MIVVLFALLCSVYGDDDPLRLIAFNETYSQWMRESEVKKLSESKETHFMDITEYTAPIKYSGSTVKIPSGPTHQDVVKPLLTKISSANIVETIRWFSAYSTRYYTSTTGVQAVNDLIGEYTRYGNNHPRVEVQAFSHQPTWPQPSIIARIYGSVVPDEIVIIGGHIDSTSSTSNNAPGADDDASGSSTVLEVFRVLAAELNNGWVPERTLEFHGYAAEEVGLRGSQAIATSYANAGYDVVGMLQLDMTGYIGGSSTPTIGVVTDYTNAALTAFIRTLIPEYTKFINGGTNTECGYGCSDHASWTARGYRAAFTFESEFRNSNPNIHTSRDTLSNLNPAHMLEFGKLALSFLVELSYQEK